jgi:hypothetical protein
MPNGAKCQTARHARQREMPDDARRQTAEPSGGAPLGVYGILCVRSYSRKQELR